MLKWLSDDIVLTYTCFNHRSCPAAASTTNSEINNVAQYWVRNAPDRDGREEEDTGLSSRDRWQGGGGHWSQLQREMAGRRGHWSQLQREMAGRRGHWSQLQREMAGRRGHWSQLQREMAGRRGTLVSAPERDGREERTLVSATTHIGSSWTDWSQDSLHACWCVHVWPASWLMSHYIEIDSYDTHMDQNKTYQWIILRQMALAFTLWGIRNHSSSPSPNCLQITMPVGWV